MRSKIRGAGRKLGPFWRVESHYTAINLPQPPPTSTTSTNLRSGRRFHVREGWDVQKPQPPEPRVLIHLDEQQAGDAHDVAAPLAPHPEGDHQSVWVLPALHRRAHPP